MLLKDGSDNYINSTMIKGIKSFKQYDEAQDKEVVFTFGRFNPPTIGHEKLIQKVVKEATGNNYRIYASQSNDPKRNPLEYREKIKVMRKMFPRYGRNIIEDKSAKTVMHVLSSLHNEGYTKVSMVVGSDRIPEFKKLIAKYNGKNSTHGFYDFKGGVNMVSAGDRDPDSDDVSGMSASKMRKAAMEGDFKSFSNGLPKSYGEDMTLFNLIRKRMGLKEMTKFREHIQLPSVSEKRERFIAGDIFNVGDEVYCPKTNESFTIKERGANYVVSSIDTKYFIQDLEEDSWPMRRFYTGLSKSTVAKRKAHFNKYKDKPDDQDSSYKKAPGDFRAKTEPSQYTKAYHKKFGKKEKEEDVQSFKDYYEMGTDDYVKYLEKETPGQELTEQNTDATLKKKADASGFSLSILKQVFKRGVAAWKTGHKPGTTPIQWGFARVNSFITGGRTRVKGDPDLWAKQKGNIKKKK